MAALSLSINSYTVTWQAGEGGWEGDQQNILPPLHLVGSVDCGHFKIDILNTSVTDQNWSIWGGDPVLLVCYCNLDPKPI